MVGKTDEDEEDEEEEPQAMHHGAQNWHIDKYGKAQGLPTSRASNAAAPHRHAAVAHSAAPSTATEGPSAQSFSSWWQSGPGIPRGTMTHGAGREATGVSSLGAAWPSGGTDIGTVRGGWRGAGQQVCRESPESWGHLQVPHHTCQVNYEECYTGPCRSVSPGDPQCEPVPLLQVPGECWVAWVPVDEGG